MAKSKFHAARPPVHHLVYDEPHAEFFRNQLITDAADLYSASPKDLALLPRRFRAVADDAGVSFPVKRPHQPHDAYEAAWAAWRDAVSAQLLLATDSQVVRYGAMGYDIRKASDCPVCKGRKR